MGKIVIPKIEIQSFNISASAISMFEECERKWAHSFLYKSKKDEVSQKPLKIGIAMHSLIEKFYENGEFENKKWLFDNWPLFYKKEMSGLQQLQKDIDDGFVALENLYSILKKQKWLQNPWNVGRTKGVEYYFKFPFLGHDKYTVNITGKIDLLMNLEDGVSVIDWKTGKSVKYQVDTLDDSIQLILYSVALKKMLNVEEEKLFLVYFYANKVKEFKVENSHFQLVKQKINHLLDVYYTKKYSKNVSWACNQCEYRSICQGKTGSIFL